MFFEEIFRIITFVFFKLLVSAGYEILRKNMLAIEGHLIIFCHIWMESHPLKAMRFLTFTCQLKMFEYSDKIDIFLALH